MRFRSSPLTVFAAICSVLIPAGAGLTAPIWLAMRGLPYKLASEVGTRIFGGTVAVLTVFFLVFWFGIRPRLDFEPAQVEADLPDPNAPPTWKDRVAHSVAWLLFVLPFVLILLGFILGQVEQAGAPD